MFMDPRGGDLKMVVDPQRRSSAPPWTSPAGARPRNRQRGIGPSNIARPTPDTMP